MTPYKMFNATALLSFVWFGYVFLIESCAVDSTGLIIVLPLLTSGLYAALLFPYLSEIFSKNE